MSIRSFVMVATMVVASIPASAIVIAQEAPARRPDVIYVPTPEAVVEAMLQVANVGKDDIVYDLGLRRWPHSGDRGQEVRRPRHRHRHRSAADRGSQRERAEEQRRRQGEDHPGRPVQQDLSEATVVTLYLLPSLNVKLMPKLMKELKPGTRIVSHAFDMGDWKPEKEIDVEGRKVYYWTIPKR